MIVSFALMLPLLMGAPSVTADDLREHARVIVVTLDGARYQDVLDENGAFAHARERPAMRRLLQRVQTQGATFRAKTSSRVALSLPGYQALFAGQQTSCDANDCARITVETFAEAVARRLKLSPSQVAVVASWSRLARAASAKDGAILVDTIPDGPPRRGGPPWPNARWDKDTVERALEIWRNEKPRLLYVGLLDMDERAHQGDQQGTVRALQNADEALGKIFDEIDRLPDNERKLTTVIVTADHGRGLGPLWTDHGKYVPTSDRMFLLATGDLIKARGLQKREVTQAELKATVERLMGLCSTGGIEELVGSLPCTE
jgi:hypothetical protein